MCLYLYYVQWSRCNEPAFHAVYPAQAHAKRKRTNSASTPAHQCYGLKEDFRKRATDMKSLLATSGNQQGDTPTRQDMNRWTETAE